MVRLLSARKAMLAGVVLFVSLAVVVALYERQLNRRHQAFLDIQEGASESSMIATFGQPQKVARCGDWFWWGNDAAYRGKNDGRCVKWIVYRHFLGGYGVGFDAEGQVVSKYEYVSD